MDPEKSIQIESTLAGSAADLPSFRWNFPAAPPLYAPPCFPRCISTTTLLFDFMQNDALAAWGFNYNEA